MFRLLAVFALFLSFSAQASTEASSGVFDRVDAFLAELDTYQSPKITENDVDEASGRLYLKLYEFIGCQFDSDKAEYAAARKYLVLEAARRFDPDHFVNFYAFQEGIVRTVLHQSTSNGMQVMFEILRQMEGRKRIYIKNAAGLSES